MLDEGRRVTSPAGRTHIESICCLCEKLFALLPEDARDRMEGFDTDSTCPSCLMSQPGGAEAVLLHVLRKDGWGKPKELYDAEKEVLWKEVAAKVDDISDETGGANLVCEALAQSVYSGLSKPLDITWWDDCFCRWEERFGKPDGGGWGTSRLVSRMHPDDVVMRRFTDDAVGLDWFRKRMQEWVSVDTEMHPRLAAVLHTNQRWLAQNRLLTVGQMMTLPLAGRRENDSFAQARGLFGDEDTAELRLQRLQAEAADIPAWLTEHRPALAGLPWEWAWRLIQGENHQPSVSDAMMSSAVG